MAQTVTHDVLILGAGLAGLRAAVELCSRLEGRVSVGIVSKVQLMRAHSVCAEGGTAAVLRPEEGDSIELHAWDTVKGSDFLADQDVVRRFVAAIPGEINQLDHLGIPWTRDEQGRIAQRPFGGHSFPRATLAADKTGFFEMQTLYDQLLRYNSFVRYDELFVTDILVEDGRFGGLLGIHAPSGETVVLRGKALLIASGGGGTLYGFTTYSETVTGDGMAMAFRAGLPLEDMEFLQFHPTGLVPNLHQQYETERRNKRQGNSTARSTRSCQSSTPSGIATNSRTPGRARRDAFLPAGCTAGAKQDTLVTDAKAVDFLKKHMPIGPVRE